MAGARGRARPPIVAGAARSGLVDPLRETEVEDLDVPVAADEEVLWFQVPVHDAPLVRGGQALRDLERIVHRLLLRDETRVELSAQRLAFEQLHDREGDAALGTVIKD
jgi:hypothetical protein